MGNLLERGTSTADGNRRNVKALINPNLRENWHEMSPDVGLVALAIAYREKYYRPPKSIEVVEEAVVQQNLEASKKDGASLSLLSGRTTGLTSQLTWKRYDEFETAESSQL